MESKIETIYFSKKAKRSLVIKILVIWFFIYFPFINFIRDYFMFSRPIESTFFVKLLIFIYALMLLVLFIFRFFSNWAIRILPEGLIIRSFYGEHFFHYRDVKDVEVISSRRGRPILRLTLSRSWGSPKLIKPLKRLFVKTDKDGNPCLLLNLADLDVDIEYLLRLIAAHIRNSENPAGE
ncbi:hypothetical protein C5745_19380 [Sphingobacterium haloxyli]|uniref:Uncharacterized protein n=1 Tax=Sphingobacterium haloxyli TaxID=2100533 RepID=A0A2S9IVJ3_9SPHI|nr:hypothetical protein C5745_19380 [Sphingobacterium haloxyli]